MITDFVLFTATYSPSLYCFLITFQQPICSSTGAFVTIIIALCWGDIPTWSSRYGIKTHTWSKPRQAKIMTISDFIKAQNTPQFTWCTHWTGLWVPMAHQTIWSKKAWNSLIVLRFPSRKELRKSQYMLRLTRHNLELSTSLRSRSLISSQRFWLDFRILRRKIVQHYLTSDQIDKHHCKGIPHRCRPYEGKLWWMHQRLPWGSHRVLQCQWPADPLAL